MYAASSRYLRASGQRFYGGPGARIAAVIYENIVEFGTADAVVEFDDGAAFALVLARGEDLFDRVSAVMELSADEEDVLRYAAGWIFYRRRDGTVEWEVFGSGDKLNATWTMICADAGREKTDDDDDGGGPTLHERRIGP